MIHNSHYLFDGHTNKILFNYQICLVLNEILVNHQICPVLLEYFETR